MKIAIEKISRDLATIRGELYAPDCEPAESPFPGLAQRVRLLVPIILVELIKAAPWDVLEEVKILESTITADDSEVAEIKVPDDFLRLVSLQAGDWQKAVTHITSADDEEGARQHSIWKGVKGNPAYPVVMMAHNAKGDRVFQLFTTISDKARMAYIAKPEISDDDTIEIPAPLYGELINKLENKMKTD